MCELVKTALFSPHSFVPSLFHFFTFSLLHSFTIKHSRYEGAKFQPCPSLTSRCAGRASTICATSMCAFRATRSRWSPASAARARARLPSTPSMPRASAATWRRSRPTRASFSTRSSGPTWTPSKDSARPSPSSRRPPAAARAPPWAPSPRSTITCACSTPRLARPTAPTADGPSPVRPPTRSSSAFSSSAEASASP